MIITNLKADNLTVALSKMAKNAKGIVGYAIARNIRTLNEDLTEYRGIKEDLFKKYGELKDGYYSISKQSENYALFLDEIEPFNKITHEVDLMTVKEQDLIESGLTGEEMFILMEVMVDGV